MIIKSQRIFLTTYYERTINEVTKQVENLALRVILCDSAPLKLLLSEALVSCPVLDRRFTGSLGEAYFP